MASDWEDSNAMAHIMTDAGLVGLSANGHSVQNQRYLSRAVVMNPSNAQAWLALSLHQATSLPTMDLAVRLSRSVDKLHDGGFGWTTLIRCQALLCQLSVAPSLLETVLLDLDQLTSSSSGFLQQSGYLLMGVALALLGQPEPSRQAFKQALLLDPSWPLPYYMLAQSYGKQGLVSAERETLKELQPVCGLGPLLEAAFQIRRDERKDAYERITAFLAAKPIAAARVLQIYILAQDPASKKRAAKLMESLERASVPAQALDLLEDTLT
ncbi:hypothetical protein HDU91_001332 [Kappamyces sp. JEL0680]|nr:hypothetical protein HDU91_001332 [Kappamyces sp. JEL0680]